MSLGSGSESAVASRLALEALRSGVPNRSAVRLLGCNQPRVEKQFAEMLEKAADAEEPAQGGRGCWSRVTSDRANRICWRTWNTWRLSRISCAARWQSAKRRRCTTWGRCLSRRWRTGGCRTAAAG